MLFNYLAACVSFDNDELFFKELWSNDFSDEELTDLLSADSFFNLSNKKKKELIQRLNFADKAHITIGLAGQEKAMQSGLDMINLKMRYRLNEMLHKEAVKHETDEFEFTYLNNCYCLAKLKEPFLVSGIFSFEI